MNNINEILTLTLLVVSSLAFCAGIFWTLHSQKDHKTKF